MTCKFFFVYWSLYAMNWRPGGGGESHIDLVNHVVQSFFQLQILSATSGLQDEHKNNLTLMNWIFFKKSLESIKPVIQPLCVVNIVNAKND